MSEPESLQHVHTQISHRAPLQPLTDDQARDAAHFWRQRLRIPQRIILERISRFQVTGEDGRPGWSLVGVVYDTHIATIYHTRILTLEDIVHELLHVQNPSWTESRVVYQTQEIVDSLRSRELSD